MDPLMAMLVVETMGQKEDEEQHVKFEVLMDVQQELQFEKVETIRQGMTTAVVDQPILHPFEAK
jgi:hypothetical protein